MANIEIIRGGDMLTDDSDAIAVPVNCVGIMGAGLALAVRNKYPGVLRPYRLACNEGLIKPGDAKVYDRFKREGAEDAPRYLILVATKGDWRNPSMVRWVSRCVNSLVHVVNKTESAETVSVPALGCGLGELSWTDVQTVIERGLAGLNEDKTARVYAPR